MQRYHVHRPTEQVWWPLYDTARIDRLPELLNFFQVPMHSIGMEPKTEADTNMYTSGQISSGNCFLVSGIRVAFTPDAYLHRNRYHADLQDIKRVLLGGRLEFRVGNRIYSQGAPLARFPSCFQQFANISPDLFRRFLQKRSLLRVQKDAYFKIVPVMIQENQHFAVTIRYGEREQLKLNAPGKLQVILDGVLVRD